MTELLLGGLLAVAIGGLGFALSRADDDSAAGDCGPGCRCGCALDVGPADEEITPTVRVRRGQGREEL